MGFNYEQYEIAIANNSENFSNVAGDDADRKQINDLQEKVDNSLANLNLRKITSQNKRRAYESCITIMNDDSRRACKDEKIKDVEFADESVSKAERELKDANKALNDLINRVITEKKTGATTGATTGTTTGTPSEIKKSKKGLYIGVGVLVIGIGVIILIKRRK